MAYVRLVNHSYPEVEITKSEATPLPTSRGALKIRVHFKGELEEAEFKIAVTLRQFSLHWGCVPFHVMHNGDPKKVWFNLQSMIKRLKLPKQIIVRASGDDDLGRVIQLAEDRLALDRGFREISPMIERARQKERIIRLSKRVCKLSASIYIGSDGFVAIDQGSPSLGEGAFARVKPSITLQNDLIARRILKDSHNANRLFKIYETFNNKPGIIQTFSKGNYENKYGQTKTVFFHPRYAYDLHSLLTFCKKSLSLNDVMDITHQLLQGLHEISMYGIHQDINHCNVLFRKIGGKYQAVISDLDLFYFHDDSAKKLFRQNNACSPPETRKGRLVVPEKADVWSMGFVLLLLPLSLRKHAERNLAAAVPHIQRSVFSNALIEEHVKSFHLPPFMGTLFQNMLTENPEKRWTAKEALNYFNKSKQQWLIRLASAQP